MIPNPFVLDCLVVIGKCGSVQVRFSKRERKKKKRTCARVNTSDGGMRSSDIVFFNIESLTCETTTRC